MLLFIEILTLKSMCVSLPLVYPFFSVSYRIRDAMRQKQLRICEIDVY